MSVATSDGRDGIPVEATSLPLSFPAHVRAAALEYAHTGVRLSRHLNQHAGFPQPQPLDVADIALGPAHAAELMRAEWRLSDRPVRNVVRLLEAVGVRVFSLGQGRAEVGTFSFVWGGVPYVFLRTRWDAVAQRFSLASELGHLAMHAADNEPAGTPHRIEEAKSFARAFLMPPSALYAHGSAWASRDVISASNMYGAPTGEFLRHLHALGAIDARQKTALATDIDGSPTSCPVERSEHLQRVRLHALHEAASKADLSAVTASEYLRDLTIRSV